MITPSHHIATTRTTIGSSTSNQVDRIQSKIALIQSQIDQLEEELEYVSLHPVCAAACMTIDDMLTLMVYPTRNQWSGSSGNHPTTYSTIAPGSFFQHSLPFAWLVADSSGYTMTMMKVQRTQGELSLTRSYAAASTRSH